MSKVYFELPLKPVPMNFTVRNSREQIYKFSTQYREADETGWILDIDDGHTGEPMVHGIPLVTGLDLMWQYNYLDQNFHLIMQCADGRTTPTAQSLGVEDKLIMVFYDHDALSPLLVMLDKTPLYTLDFQVRPDKPHPKSRSLLLAYGSFAVTGRSVGLSKSGGINNYLLPLARGTFTVTGQSVGLTKSGASNLWTNSDPWVQSATWSN